MSTSIKLCHNNRTSLSSQGLGDKKSKKSCFSRFFETISNLFKGGSLSDKKIIQIKKDPADKNHPSTQKKISIPVNDKKAIDIEVPKNLKPRSENKQGHGKAEHSQENHIESVLETSEAAFDSSNELKYGLFKKIHKSDDKSHIDHPGFEMAEHTSDMVDSTLSTLIGVNQAITGSKQLKEANKINDNWGKVDAGLGLTCGTMKSISGSASIASESLTIAAKKTASATNKAAIPRIKVAGGTIGIIRIALLSLKTIFNMHHSISFAKGLKKAMSTSGNEDPRKKGLNYLVSQLEVSPSELKKLEEKCAKKPQTYDGKEIVAQKKSPLLNKREKAICQRRDGSWNQSLAKEIIKLKKKKQAQFIRSAGKETFKKVATLLQQNENSGIPRAKWFSYLGGKGKDKSEKKTKAEVEAEELLAAVGTSTKEIILKQKGSIGKLALFATIITMTILGMVGTGGALAIVTLAGSILIALTFLILDLKELRELYKEGELSARDKVLLGLAVGLMTISVSLDIIFPGGAGALVRSGIMEGLWTMIYGYSYIRHSRNNKADRKSITINNHKPVKHKPTPIPIRRLPKTKRKVSIIKKNLKK